MMIHHPAKAGCHKHCRSRDMNILGNTVILPQMWDIPDCICPLTFTFIIFSKAHSMSYLSRITTYGTILTKTFFSVSNEVSLILHTRLLGKE